ncbi:MAG: hypothetical protein O2960_30505 [Verrucomicrobia bacterium]|nr:hypothetical protein [Verrucomicrobiota bacterium]
MITPLLIAAVAYVSSASLFAATDVSGTWSWSFEGRDGQARESSMELKQEGAKITGVIKGGRGDSTIEEGKLNGKELSFKTTRETQNGSFTANYKATVEGDSLKGNIAIKFGDRDIDREWVAKRAGVDPTGTWAWSMEQDNGDKMEATFKLKRDGNVVTGAFTREDSDFNLEIKNAKMAGSTLTFETVFDRDGSSTTIKNSAVITGSIMKGKSEGKTPDGETFSLDWTAKRK